MVRAKETSAAHLYERGTPNGGFFINTKSYIMQKSEPATHAALNLQKVNPELLEPVIKKYVESDLFRIYAHDCYLGNFDSNPFFLDSLEQKRKNMIKFLFLDRNVEITIRVREITKKGGSHV